MPGARGLELGSSLKRSLWACNSQCILTYTASLHRTCICLPRNKIWHQSHSLMIPLLERLEAWKRFSSLDSWWLLEVIRIVSSSTQGRTNPLKIHLLQVIAWSVGLTTPPSSSYPSSPDFHFSFPSHLNSFLPCWHAEGSSSSVFPVTNQ